jgi:Polyketide cyclase / dehydrase and lipid transport
MKELRGTATGLVAAPVEQCVRFFQAIDCYPSWYPEVVRELEVVERDDQGRPTRAHTALHISYGPLVRSLRLLLAVRVEQPSTVRLTRLRNEPSDPEQFEVVWRLAAEGGPAQKGGKGGNTRVRLELDANLSVPRLLPLGGVGDAMAEGFVGAAVRGLGGREAAAPPAP